MIAGGKTGASVPLVMALSLDSAALFGRPDGKGLTHHHWQPQEVGATRQVHSPFLPVHLLPEDSWQLTRALAWRMLAGGHCLLSAEMLPWTTEAVSIPHCQDTFKLAENFFSALSKH